MAASEDRSFAWATGVPQHLVRPLLRRLAWAALVAAALAYGTTCAMGNDFLSFRDVGLAALRRGDLYGPSPTNGMTVFYAPYFSLLMMPFAALPAFAAGYLWFLGKAVALGWVIREGWLEVRKSAADLPRPRLWPLYLGLPLLLAANPIVGEMRLGQVNLFVFVLTLYAVRALETEKTWRAALAFSVALVKMTPWVFLPWFLLRRQWRFLGALAIAGAGWLVALVAWFGPRRVPELLLDELEASRTHKLTIDAVAYFENQSVIGVATRLAKQLPRLAEPILGVPAYAVLWIAVVMSLFGVLVALAWRDGFRPVLPRMEFAFLCLVMYLCSPDSRWAHEMQLLAPFMALAALAARLRPFSRSWPAPPGWRLAAGVVIGAGVLFQVVVTSDIVGAPLDQSARALSTHFLFVMGLAVLLALVQLSRRTARPAGLRAKDDPLGLRAAFPIEGVR